MFVCVFVFFKCRAVLILIVLFFPVLSYFIVLNLFTVQHFGPVLAILKSFITKAGLGKARTFTF